MRRVIALALCGVLAAACTSAGDGSGEPDPTPTPTASPSGGGSLRWALAADPTSLDPSRIVTREDELVVDALFDSLTRLGPDLDVQPALATSWRAEEDATRWVFELDPEARWSDDTPVVAADVLRGLRRVADQSGARPSLHAELLQAVQGFATARQGIALSGVRALDDRTVEIVLARPEPQLPAILSHPALAPVPPAADEEPIAFAEGALGNGPFRLAEPWAHNQFLRLEPSPTHPSPPLLDELVLRVYAGDTTGEVRWSDLLGGQVQVAQVPLTRRDEVGATLGVGALRDELLDVTTVALVATDQPVTDDVRVRRAISLFVDREGVAARTNGSRVVARELVPPSLPGSVPSSCRWCRHDPAAAASLVAAALAEDEREAAEAVEEADVGAPDATAEPVDGDGPDDEGGAGDGQEAVTESDGRVGDEGADGAVGEAGPDASDGGGDATQAPSDPDASPGATDGATDDRDSTGDGAEESGSDEPRPVVLILSSTDGVSTTIARQVRDGLRSAGIDARSESVAAALLPGAVEERDPAVVIVQWTSLVPTAERFVVELVGPRSLGRTITGWRPPAVGELLQSIWSTADLAERAGRTHELERLATDEAVVLPLLHATSELAVAPSVRGFEAGPDGAVDLTRIEVAPAP